MAQATKPKKIIFYRDNNETEPFTEWLNSLKDQSGKRRIITRLRRLEQGNYGDCKALGQGVHELRLFFGAGYRIYFGEDGDKIVVILCGGDKSSQSKDIEFAQNCWEDYKDE